MDSGREPHYWCGLIHQNHYHSNIDQCPQKPLWYMGFLLAMTNSTRDQWTLHPYRESGNLCLNPIVGGFELESKRLAVITEKGVFHHTVLYRRFLDEEYKRAIHYTEGNKILLFGVEATPESTVNSIIESLKEITRMAHNQGYSYDPISSHVWERHVPELASWLSNIDFKSSPIDRLAK